MQNQRAEQVIANDPLVQQQRAQQLDIQRQQGVLAAEEGLRKGKAAETAEALGIAQSVVSAFGDPENSAARIAEIRVRNPIDTSPFKTDDDLLFHSENLVAAGQNLSAAKGAKQRADEALRERLETDEERATFDRIQAGLEPAAKRGIPSIKTLGDGTQVLFDPNAATRDEMFTSLNTAEEVAKAKGLIKEEEGRGTGRGQIATKFITKGFESIQAIDKNIRTIDRAIKAIDGGASTGVIERMLPSVRKSSIELDQVQNELGLDVIGSVTFGALSEGELNLALDTALPTGLEPPELRAWLVEKKNAQSKLRGYFNDQVQFLSAGGNVDEFVIEQENKLSQQSNTTVIKFEDLPR